MWIDIVAQFIGLRANITTNDICIEICFPSLLGTIGDYFPDCRLIPSPPPPVPPSPPPRTAAPTLPPSPLPQPPPSSLPSHQAVSGEGQSVPAVSPAAGQGPLLSGGSHSESEGGSGQIGAQSLPMAAQPVTGEGQSLAEGARPVPPGASDLGVSQTEFRKRDPFQTPLTAEQLSSGISCPGGYVILGNSKFFVSACTSSEEFRNQNRAALLAEELRIIMQLTSLNGINAPSAQPFRIPIDFVAGRIPNSGPPSPGGTPEQ